ncbi:MAG: glutamine amidotransferase [Pseudomonadota bacterium]
MPAHATVLQHLAFEHLDGFAPPLAQAGIDVTTYLVPEDLPQTIDPKDLLIILGGPIGVYEQDAYPFLTAELALIKAHLDAGGATLGICLGAQLIACALGAHVYPSGGQEIGLAPITLTAAGAGSCLAPFADAPRTLHWHGDTFDLPAGATRLASTALCENQAFAFGPRVIGFQFHPEATGAGIEHWLVGHCAELAQAQIDRAALRAEVRASADELSGKAEAVMSAWLGSLAAA